MKNILAASVLSAFLIGCATNPTVGPAVTQTAVTGITAWALQTDANVRPYLTAAQPIICQLANGGTIDPAVVASALQSSSMNELKTPTGTIALNAILACYESVYYSFGSSVQQSQAQPYLLAVCNGLTTALGTTANLEVMAKAPTGVPPSQWPHVK
jgi:hypothetical protein